MPTTTLERDDLTFGFVASEILREATGRGWERWLLTLDAAGAEYSDRADIVTYLRCEHPDVASRWRRSIAVGYEQARGKLVPLTGGR